MDYDEEIVQDFLVESYEMLNTLDESFVMLEEDPGDTEVLGAIFRVMHTIKGTSAFLGFHSLETLGHKAENLLSLLRDGDLELSVPMADALLSTVDRIRQFLGQIEETGSDGGVETADLVSRLTGLAEAPVEATVAAGAIGGEPAVEAASPASSTEAPGFEPANAGSVDAGAAGADDAPIDDGSTEATPVPPASGPAGGDNGEGHRVGDILVDRHGVERVDVEIAAAEQGVGDTRKIGEILTDQGAAAANQVDAALERQKEQTAGNSSRRRSAADSTIRVDVELLDDLMNLIGELVLTRNEILQFITDTSDRALAMSTQRLDLLTSDLQDKVMTTRMQPIGSLWNKLPRVVRDLGHQLGKDIRLEMEGKETELDKSLIESIKDPLTHIVRNTVDHGIEVPEIRRELGKPEQGLLQLTAGHQDGHVVITIADDGAGINLDRIKAKAVDRELITADRASAMSDDEVVQLIFHAGFSTAEKVTNVSGRGVGMDVVRTNIEQIGGSVEVRTVPGEGTTFRIEIPLTLAIVPALVVTCADARYAIPQRSLLELVSVDGSAIGHSVEFVHDAPVIRLRDRLLPVVDLRRVLGEDARDEYVGDMVVLSAEGGEFSLLVDEIVETQEIVVKPLGQVVHEVEMFSGATILGDGQVALILDVIGLGQQAQVANSRNGGLESEGGSGEITLSASTAALESLLVLSMGGDRQVAMALSDVERLDEFRAEDLELSGHREVVQYRSEIMPLVDLASELGYSSTYGMDDRERISVVVYRHNGRDVGLIIDQMIDIVDHHQTEQTATGNLIIQGRVTEMVDAARLPSLAAIEAEYTLEEVGL
ncbi:MAG: chemotaxis protein CheA [Actinomycetota bacterium]